VKKKNVFHILFIHVVLNVMLLVKQGEWGIENGNWCGIKNSCAISVYTEEEIDFDFEEEEEEENGIILVFSIFI